MVDDEVDAATAGELEHRLGDVGIAVVIDRVGAPELECLGDLVRPAGRADHGGASGDGELHEGGRHARAGGVHEHGLAGLRPDRR